MSLWLIFPASTPLLLVIPSPPHPPPAVPCLRPQVAGTEILAYVNRVREVEAANVDHATMTLEQIESNPVRCPDQASADLMYQGGWGLWVHGCV